jgi:hypothetical protein
MNLKGTWINKRSNRKWRVDSIDVKDQDVVMVKLEGKPLTKVITIKSLLKNWKRI